MDSEAAVLLGVRPMIIFVIAIAVGSALAGIAGGMMAPIMGANSHLSGIILLAILIVLVAGHGSMKGAVIIGLLVGMVESFGYQFLGTWYLLALFILLGIIIYFRPEGLFGEAPPEV
jgi:branched-chain amino acid transport system permease protein